MGKILKRFTPEEDKILLEEWWDRTRRDEIAKRLGRSKGSLDFRYYALLKKKGIDPQVHKARMQLMASGGDPNTISDVSREDSKPPISPSTGERDNAEVRIVYGEDVDVRLEKLEKSLEALQKTVDGLIESAKTREDNFVTWLENILYLYKNGGKALDMSLLVKENADLKSKVGELRAQIDAMEERMREQQERYNKIYNEMNFWLGQFFRLSSVEKIATLEDFLPRIKTLVDKYGTVIGITSDKRGDTISLMRKASGMPDVADEKQSDEH